MTAPPHSWRPNSNATGNAALRVPSAEKLIAEVRRHGLGRVDGEMLPGVGALAAPVRDHAGKLAFVLTTLGPQGVFDSRWDGAIAGVLRDVAAAAGQRLGAR